MASLPSAAAVRSTASNGGHLQRHASHGCAVRALAVIALLLFAASRAIDRFMSTDHQTVMGPTPPPPLVRMVDFVVPPPTPPSPPAAPRPPMPPQPQPPPDSPPPTLPPPPNTPRPTPLPPPLPFPSTSSPSSPVIRIPPPSAPHMSLLPSEVPTPSACGRLIGKADLRSKLPPLFCFHLLERMDCLDSFVAVSDGVSTRATRLFFTQECVWGAQAPAQHAACTASNQTILCPFAAPPSPPLLPPQQPPPPGHPSPSPPWVEKRTGVLTSSRCFQMMRAPVEQLGQNKFFGMWGRKAWCARERGQAACWGSGDAWFKSVAMAGQGCARDWGTRVAGAAVLGYSDTMLKYCNSRLGHGWVARGDHASTCARAGVNILRIGGWTMCQNMEWMFCASRGQIGGGGGGAQFVFSLAPKDMDVSPFYDGRFPKPHSGCGDYSENDVYFMEVCILNGAAQCIQQPACLPKLAGDQQPWHL